MENETQDYAVQFQMGAVSIVLKRSNTDLETVLSEVQSAIKDKTALVNEHAPGETVMGFVPSPGCIFSIMTWAQHQAMVAQGPGRILQPQPAPIRPRPRR